MTRELTIVEWTLRLVEAGGSLQGEASPDPGSGSDAVRRLAVMITDQATGAPRAWVSPKSIVGALGAHLRVVAGQQRSYDLLGDPVDGSRAGASPPRPSRLRVLGSSVELPDGVEAFFRYRGAQDRWSGAAKSGHLVQQEWLPEGSIITCWAVIDNSGQHRDLRELLITASAGQRDQGGSQRPSWAPQLGAGKSVGHGQTVLARFRTLDLALDRVADLAVIMGGLSPASIPRLLDQRGHDHDIIPPRVPGDWLRAEWTIDAPLHVGGRPGSDDAGQIRRVAVDTDGRPVVPGTSWKGLLRARCEFILRSLGVAVCAGGTRSCATCPTCQIFGGVHVSDADERTVGSGLSASIGVRTTMITNAAEPASIVEHTHVAIDRFTGGAAESLLYRQEVVPAGAAVLQLTQRRGLPPWAEPLIRRALLDLDDGLVGLGGMSSRGYGTLKISGDALAPRGSASDWTEAVRLLRHEFPTVSTETEVHR